jgi:endoglucanase
MKVSTLSRTALLSIAASCMILTECNSDPGGKKTRKASPLAGAVPARVVPGVDAPNPAGSFVAQHGRLSVSGPALVDQTGRTVQLRGLSSYWINWEEGRAFVNPRAIAWLARDWGITVYRIAVGVEPEGAYASDPEAMITLVRPAIDACIEEGIYVIVDWHVHDAPPYKTLAASFFKGIAKAYGKYPNLIYEIWNEPLQVSWNGQIKPYAEEMIRDVIRPLDRDNVILVGSPSWSQDVDDCVRDPIDVKNVMYSLHFYAGTHGDGLRRKADAALKAGLPIFVSEWGASASDGGANGEVYLEAADAWVTWMNERGLSWVNWSVSNKAESSAALRSGAPAAGGWVDAELTPSGLYVREMMSKR